jgi:NADP-dependent 3-hydroxy acid dehydrogenase YdfG
MENIRKRVALTGHTSGIGKAIYNTLKKEGYNIVGLSRSTGFDLSKFHEKSFQDKLYHILKDVDIFINNAHLLYTQIDILYFAYDEWRSKNKTIINISSTSGDKAQDKKQQLSYQIEKIALDEACKQLDSGSKCKVINIRPGWVDTPAAKNYYRPIGITMLKPQDVADIVAYILNQPNEIYIKNISIEPWYKKK